MSFRTALRKFFSLARRPLHPLIAHNQQRFPRGEEYHGLLQDYEFVVLDTELTGFSPSRDEIVAMGAVRIKKQQILCAETFYALVRPRSRFQTESTLVHRLTPQELQRAAGLEEVLPRFIDFCGDAFLVGHFVRLDLEFINRAAMRLLGGVLTTPYLDTMGLAMNYHDLLHGAGGDHTTRQGAYTLSSLSADYGLPPFQAHDALQDALQTAYLFLYLCKKMRGHGIATMQEFLKAGQRFNHPWWSM